MFVVRLYHWTCEIIYGLFLPLAFVIGCAAASYGCLSFLGDYAARRGHSFEWVATPHPSKMSRPKHVVVTDIDATRLVAPRSKGPADSHRRDVFKVLAAKLRNL